MRHLPAWLPVRLGARPGQSSAAKVLGLVLPVFLIISPARADVRQGASEEASRRLLVDYFEGFLRDQDVDQFRQKVSSRFNEASLTLALRSAEPQARRAAALALGLVGTMKVNETVARALDDQDALVRRLAHSALWSIWFRADTPEHNAALQRIALLNGQNRYQEAETQAAQLIENAPAFAEAVNQRAIALFFQGRYADSARDCRKVLELNPVHMGALSGLAQCYLRMGDRRQALETYRRALALEPRNDALRLLVLELAAPDV